MNKVFSFCTILMLCFSVCFGSQPHVDNLIKVYVAQENIFFKDGCLLIADGQHLLCVKTLLDILLSLKGEDSYGGQAETN